MMNQYIKSIILTLCFAVVALHGFAQLPQNLLKSDSTAKENFTYIVNVPQQDRIKGVAVLLPGLYDPPLSVFFESRLPHLLNELNYAVIIPVLAEKGDRFDLSKSAILQLTQLVHQYIQSQGLSPAIDIILGGFSAGGTRVLKAITAKDSPMNTLNITHAFAIDPPMDLNRLIQSEERYGNSEIKEVLNKELGELDTKKLAALSVVDLDNLHKTAFYPKDKTKIRIYNEPAIEWQIKNRKRDLLDLNLLDQSVYTNHIKRTYSNANIELVLSNKEGMRVQTQQRNPHSWNIIDEAEFIEWISLD